MKKSRIVALSAAVAISLGGGATLVTHAVAAPSAAISIQDASALPVLKRGSEGPAVRLLQRAVTYSGVRAEVDGHFGPATEAAVKGYQKKVGLQVDGAVGPKTWSKLLPVVKEGARGGMVTVLQLSLKDSGANVATDGSFGPATKAALLAYQKSHGLAADGVAGPRTWAALASAAKPGGGRLVAINQYRTGTYANQNCGPTSAVMALVAVGKTPEYYGGSDNYATAVHRFRMDRDRMNVPAARTSGTTGDEIRRGLASYGVKSRATDLESALAEVRRGKVVVSHGHSSRLPWLNGRSGHYILIAEYKGNDTYRVLDPAGGHDKVTSGAVLRHFASKTQPDGRTDRHYNQTVLG